MLSWIAKLLGRPNLSQTQARGRLWIVSAPSGAGKTSLVKELCKRRPHIEMSCSYTTRTRRSSEVDGVDYHFVDLARFEAMAAAGEFLEYAEVFGNHYATGRGDVDRLLSAGKNVILEIDWQGARQARGAMPEAGSIFILPPSYEELERRLRSRASDSDEVIARRLSEARSDMTHWAEFDFVVINDDFAAAASKLESILDGVGRSNRSDSLDLRKQIATLLA